MIEKEDIFVDKSAQLMKVTLIDWNLRLCDVFHVSK